MPGHRFWAYARMLSRLEAERELARYTAMLAAGGREMATDDRQRYLDELHQSVAGERRRKRARPITAAQARGMGIRLVPPADKASGEGVSR